MHKTVHVTQDDLSGCHCDHKSHVFPLECAIYREFFHPYIDVRTKQIQLGIIDFVDRDYNEDVRFFGITYEMSYNLKHIIEDLYCNKLHDSDYHTIKPFSVTFYSEEDGVNALAYLEDE